MGEGKQYNLLMQRTGESMGPLAELDPVNEGDLITLADGTGQVWTYEVTWVDGQDVYIRQVGRMQ